MQHAQMMLSRAAARTATCLLRIKVATRCSPAKNIDARSLSSYHRHPFHKSSFVRSSSSIEIALTRSYVTATPCRLMPVNVIEVPTMGDSITEGTIVDLPVAPGDFVEADAVVVVLETDKVSVDVRAPEAGVIIEVMGEIDDVVEVGAPLFRIDTDATGHDTSTAEKKEIGHDAQPEEESEPPKQEDMPDIVEQPLPPKKQPKTASSAPDTTSAPVASFSTRSERRTKMSRMRQRVAVRLKSAQNTAAMLTTFQEVDMSNLLEMRSRHKEAFEKKHGIKLGFMSAFVKASSAALQEIPAVNAYIDDDTTEIVYRDYCDISVAVASPTGLVVPVLRNTEFMSFADVEKAIAGFSQKAKDGTLSLEDMAGGTFTISNGGVFGSLMGTPIINPPQSAILGMHATKLRPAVVDGQVVPRPMMYLALTYDHRLIDGREGVTFLKSIAEKIADPTRLILEV